MVKALAKRTRLYRVVRGTWARVVIKTPGSVPLFLKPLRSRFKKGSLSFPARVVKRLLSEMDVFEFLPNFRVTVCKLCQSAIYPSAIGTHLRRSHARYNSSLASKLQIWTFTNEILPRLIEFSLLDLRNEPVIVPAIEQTPLPYLRVYNGFSYSYCSVVSQAVDKMRSHYNIAHAPERRSRSGHKCSGSRAVRNQLEREHFRDKAP
jgi:hypothetical protein